MQKSAILLGLLFSLSVSINAENSAVSPLHEVYYNKVEGNHPLAGHRVMCRLAAMHIVKTLVEEGVINLGKYFAETGILTDSFTMREIQKEAEIVLKAFVEYIEIKISRNEGNKVDNFEFLKTRYPAILEILQDKRNFVPRGRTFAERRGQDVQGGIEWVIGNPKTSTAVVVTPFILYGLVQGARVYMKAPGANAAGGPNQ